MRKVFAITGANRGLGYGCADLIFKRGINAQVVLCSRDKQRGQQAVDQLKATYPSLPSDAIILGELDISKDTSRSQFVNFIKNEVGGLDALLNNAAVMHKDTAEDRYNKSLQTASTNLLGPMHLTEALLEQKLFNYQSKIINFGTTLANPRGIRNKEFRKQVEEVEDEDDLLEILQDFLQMVRTDQDKETTLFSPSFPYPEYSFMKILLFKYSRILAEDPRIINKLMEVYTICPGWVKTDLGGPEAPMQVEQGVDTPVWLLERDLGVDSDMQGLLLSQRKVVKGRK